MGCKPESVIVYKTLAALRRRGIWARKVHGNAFQASGLPDIDAVVHGRSVRMEVKRPGEQPTALQKQCMEELERAGAFVTVVNSVDEAMEFVDYVLSRIPEEAC